MVLYIKETNNPKLIYKLFNMFTLEKKGNKDILNLPINQKSNKRKLEKNAEKVNKYLYNNNIKNVVLSTELMKIEEFKNVLYKNNINILDGSKLSKFLTYDIIKKIYNYKNTKIETGEISILVNENSEINIENIIQIAQKVKRLNIITKNVKKFKNVVEYLYDELGIIIKLSNNLKVNLTNSSVILNIDFSEEMVNEMNIPSNAVIISIPNSITIHSKKFNGVNIKNWNIDIPSIYKLENFEDNILYEAEIYNQPANIVFERIISDNIKIKNFLGTNGKINKKEFI